MAKKSSVKVLIIGGGPTGLAVAISLHKYGIKDIRILEREALAGGIPRHSNHFGYGVRDLHRIMTGPKYSNHYIEKVSSLGIPLSTRTSAIEWAADLTIATTSPNGLEEITAEKIILVTGARERPRSARLIPGSRPAGIYTTGSLQQAVFLKHQIVGTRAVVIGAEHVSFSAIMTLSHAKVKTLALITPDDSHSSYGFVKWGTSAIYGNKFLASTKVIEILGSKRVSGVRIRKEGKESIIDCDTVVFSADWVPDNELARKANLELDSTTKSPIVNSKYETSRKNVYALGNILLPIKAADQCAIEAAKLVLN
jgi:NADPH-dependent 2,4-dienoyl-CoA reductase/sulfur reductase-like enzyme